ncbi:MAG: ThiF family adenylyltransferase [Comamonadaceae bacterium]|nr:ThiF family adenylyltransferase [Comamonadaceae bacterium]
MTTLASVGVGHIGIVDNDSIETSNLNRQFVHKPENIGKSKVLSAKEWINNYNPDIKAETYQIRLDSDNCKDIIKEYDLVMDCFDTFKSKFMS